MQAMVAAVFSKLRHIPSEAPALASLSAGFVSTASLSDQLDAGVRMTAPDPRSGQFGAPSPDEQPGGVEASTPTTTADENGGYASGPGSECECICA